MKMWTGTRRNWLILLPMLVFVPILGLMVFGLGNDPRTIPSALIGKPAPAVGVPRLSTGQLYNPRQQLLGQYWLLNVWASWCLPCREEHPVLIHIAGNHPDLPIVGLNYKDDRHNALTWLETLGDPYLESLVDSDGRTAIEFGVYGVPETFTIDPQGTIIHRHTGPLTMQQFTNHIVPLISSDRL